MDSVRDKWTDERLDDLNQRVDSGFGEVREELRDSRREMRGEFESVREEIGGVRGEIQGVREEVGAVRAEIHTIGAGTTQRMDDIQRSVIQLAVALTSAIVAGFAAMCALLAAVL